MDRLKERETDDCIPGWQWDFGPIFVGVEGRRLAQKYGEAVVRCEELARYALRRQKHILKMKLQQKLVDVQREVFELAPFCVYCSLPLKFEWHGEYLKDARKLYEVPPCTCGQEPRKVRCGTCHDHLESYYKKLEHSPAEFRWAACIGCDKDQSYQFQARDRLKRFPPGESWCSEEES